MMIGGRCPLNCIENKEEFLRKELENFYNKQTKYLSVEELKKEFCRNVCENIMC